MLKNDKVIIVTTKQGFSKQKARVLEKRIKRFIVFKENINLKVLMKILAKEEEIASILIEGGAILNTSSINSRIVDELVLLIADFNVKEEGMELFNKHLKKFKLTNIHSNLLDNDLVIIGKVNY